MQVDYLTFRVYTAKTEDAYQALLRLHVLLPLRAGYISKDIIFLFFLSTLKAKVNQTKIQKAKMKTGIHRVKQYKDIWDSGRC